MMLIAFCFSEPVGMNPNSLLDNAARVGIHIPFCDFENIPKSMKADFLAEIDDRAPRLGLTKKPGYNVHDKTVSDLTQVIKKQRHGK
jgi:hypothetical protein